MMEYDFHLRLNIYAFEIHILDLKLSYVNSMLILYQFDIELVSNQLVVFNYLLS